MRTMYAIALCVPVLERSGVYSGFIRANDNPIRKKRLNGDARAPSYYPSGLRIDFLKMISMSL